MSAGMQLLAQQHPRAADPHINLADPQVDPMICTTYCILMHIQLACLRCMPWEGLRFVARLHPAGGWTMHAHRRLHSEGPLMLLALSQLHLRVLAG